MRRPRDIAVQLVSELLDELGDHIEPLDDAYSQALRSRLDDIAEVLIGTALDGVARMVPVGDHHPPGERRR